MSSDLVKQLRESQRTHTLPDRGDWSILGQAADRITALEQELTQKDALLKHAADALAASEARVERLRRISLKAYTIVEWCVGEGFLLDPPVFDVDDTLCEMVDVLGVETMEQAHIALSSTTPEPSNVHIKSDDEALEFWKRVERVLGFTLSGYNQQYSAVFWRKHAPAFTSELLELSKADAEHLLSLIDARVA